MQSFHHDGVEIAFLDEGAGEPIVLVHGFASTKEVNWVHPGWVATLTKAGAVEKNRNGDERPHAGAAPAGRGDRAQDPALRRDPPRVIGVFKRRESAHAADATLALWRVSDPGNVGTLLCSADAFGALDSCQPDGPRARRRRAAIR